MTRERKSMDKIVISGIAGRFPKAKNVNQFKENLFSQAECSTCEHDRWKIDDPRIPPHLGVIDDVVKFDGGFFGVLPKLINTMQPVQRLLLEHAYEAILDAGINPRELRGKRVAVMATTSLAESDIELFSGKSTIDGLGVVGGSRAMIANRISFFLGLTGSSYTIDSGNAGSGAALELAYNEILHGRCDAAIVAGAILTIQPHISYQLRLLGLMSEDGKTRSFDDSASGYCRSEGAAAIFLQRASDANRIYMEVLGVKSNFGGVKNVNTVMFPSKDAQASVMKELLEQSGLKPDDISFLEASGIGIKDVDAEELEAIDAVYGQRKEPLLIGSVRSNIGDAISTNTLNSVIKMIIASESQQIPPTVNYEKPNAKAACLKEGRICIPTEVVPLEGEYFSVNTTSYHGAFVNVLLKSPNKEKQNDGAPEDDLPRIVIASGRMEEAVKSLLDYMQSRPIDVEMLQLIYSTYRQDIHNYFNRGYVVLPAKGVAASPHQDLLYNASEKREVWWIFSGMGSQWTGMGKDLLKLPLFNTAIKRCDAVLKPRGYDIYKILTDDDETVFDDIVHCFIGIAAIQIGLVDILRELGLSPDYIIGHSVGELGCAYADGSFTAEEMILSALSRGLVSKETEFVKGSMAAVGLGYDDIHPLCPPDIDVACRNSFESSTISGPADSMKEFVAKLTARGIFARVVPSGNIAYHSRYIQPAGPKLLERLREVIPDPKPRSAKWLSSSVPMGKWTTLAARLSSAEYHTNNLLSSVLFDQVIRKIPKNSICIEIAPHGLLQAILKRALPNSCIHIPLTNKRHSDNLEFLFTSLGKMYNYGLNPKFENLYPKVEYPVSKGTASISSHIRWQHSTDWRVQFYRPPSDIHEGEKRFEINLKENAFKYLRGNVINERVAIPLSFYLVKIWELLKEIVENIEEDVVFEEIKIYKQLVHVPNNDSVKIALMIHKGTHSFEVSESGSVVLTGKVKHLQIPLEDQQESIAAREYDLNTNDFYTEMEMRGFQYSGDFKTIVKASLDGSKGLIKWNDDWTTFLDGILQLCAFGNNERVLEVPISIQSIAINNKLHNKEIKNEDGISVFVDKVTKKVKAGGVEMSVLKFAPLSRTEEQNRFITNNLQVLPNVSTVESSVIDTVSSMLQLVLENSFAKKLQKLQVIYKNEPKYAEATKNFILQSIPEAAYFVPETIPYSEVTDNQFLSIVNEDCDCEMFSTIVQNLADGKFVLVAIQTSLEKLYTKLALENDLNIVFKRSFDGKTYILFRRKQSLAAFQIFNDSKDVSNVIKKIKNVKVSLDNERLVLIMRSKCGINLTEFMEQLENNVQLNKIRVFYIQDTDTTDEFFTTKSYEDQLASDLLINILTPGKVWATIRRTVISSNPKLVSNWLATPEFTCGRTGVIWAEAPVMEGLKNLVKVEYSTLNPQDVLIAGGIYYSESQQSVGLEFSGVDQQGNRVMGVTQGNCMSNFVQSDSLYTWTIPKSWSFEDAATTPFSYLVAYSTLAKAQVREREIIVLDNPCDGFGQAIINIALQKNCDLFIICADDAEKKMIQDNFPKISENRLFQSHDNNVADKICMATEDKQVDVIICNQSDVKNYKNIFSMGKSTTRIVLLNDLIRNDIHEVVGMFTFLQETALLAVVPKRVLLANGETKKMLANMLKDGIDRGIVKPLTRTVYHRDSLPEAFEICQSKKRLGKIVVKVQPDKPNTNLALAIPKLQCSAKKSYLVVEGLTTFGIEFIDFLVARGARNLVITSSMGMKTGFLNLKLSRWQSSGVQLTIIEHVNPLNEADVKNALKKASAIGLIDGIFDLQRLNLSRDGNLTASKNLATQILDKESRTLKLQLHYFIVFSAIKNSGSTLLHKKFEDINKLLKSEERVIQNVLDLRKKDALPGLLVRLGLFDATKDCDNEIDGQIILPPVSKYFQKLDTTLGVNESIAEIYYSIAPIDEIEVDVDDDTNLKVEEREAEAFTASLYQQSGTTAYGQISRLITL